MSRRGGVAHLTHEDRARRRKLAFLAVAAVVVIGGWVAAIALIGAGGGQGPASEGGDRQASGEGGGSAGQSPDRIQATTPATDDGRDSESRQTGGGDGSADEQGRPDSSPQDQEGGGAEGSPRKEPAGQSPEPAPDEQSPGDGAARGLDVLSAEGASGDQAGGDTGANSSESTPEQTFPQDDPEPSAPSSTSPKADDSPEREKTGPDTNPDGAGLGEGEKSRARKAVESFIVAAYGYTGTDREAYLSGIEKAAGPEIFESPGGERLTEYGSYGPDCGMASKAALDELEVVEADPRWAAVAAHFSVEDNGVSHRFTQNQMLSIDAGGDYEVAGVGVEELISDTNPQESCPGGELPRRGEGEQTPEPGGDEGSSGNTSEESSGEQAPGEKGGGDGGSDEDSTGKRQPEVSLEEAQRAKRAVRGHYEAIGRGEFEEAYSYFGPAFRQKVPKKGWIAQHRQDGIKGARVASVKLTEFSGEKAEAGVEVSASDKTGKSSFDLTWEMVQADGDWKLNELKSTDRKGGG